MTDWITYIFITCDYTYRFESTNQSWGPVPFEHNEPICGWSLCSQSALKEGLVLDHHFHVFQECLIYLCDFWISIHKLALTVANWFLRDLFVLLVWKVTGPRAFLSLGKKCHSRMNSVGLGCSWENKTLHFRHSWEAPVPFHQGDKNDIISHDWLHLTWEIQNRHWPQLMKLLMAIDSHYPSVNGMTV